MSTAEATIRGPHFGLPLRVAILAAVFLAEKIFLNQFVDFDAAQNAQGLGAMLRIAQHWGFRFVVALIAALALFAYVRGERVYGRRRLPCRRRRYGCVGCWGTCC